MAQAPPNRFFAPTFFSPFYFPSLIKDGIGSGGSGGQTYRDQNAFDALVSALSATNEFADVSIDTTSGIRSIGSDRSPLAVITPVGWSEIDDADPILLIRHVHFTITLIVRNEVADERFQILDRLSNIAQNAIDGTDLGGGCIPGLTKLRRGFYDRKSSYPEQALLLHGELTYLISSFDGHSEI